MCVCEFFVKDACFCASGRCPDEKDIPAGCTGECMVESRLGHTTWTPTLTILPERCPLSDNCPCARPADSKRREAFDTWLDRKLHRRAVAKAEKKPRKRDRRAYD